MEVKLEGVGLRYGKKALFEDMSLVLTSDQDSGKVIVVLGQSGCGKSTLLRLISGIQIPDKGEVSIIEDGKVWNEIIGYVTQEPVLLEQLSRYENACFRKIISSTRSSFNESVFNHTLKLLGLDDKFLSPERPMKNMSGGEAKRLAIVRELSTNSRLLLLDEPCDGVHSSAKQRFLSFIRRLSFKQNRMVIVSTHSWNEASLIADEIIYMSNGHSTNTGSKIWRGSVKEFLSNPPGIDAAHMIYEPVLNVTNLSTLRTLGVRVEVIGKDFASLLDGMVAFRPNICSWSKINGIPAPILLRGDLWTMIELEPAEMEGYWQIQTQGYERDSFLKISGEAFLFAKPDLPPEKIWLEA